MHFTERSRTELGWICPRARYWAYHWHDIGLAPLETPKDLHFGLLMAEQLAQIKRSLPWSVEAFMGESKELARGLLTGYEQIVWPRWLRDYDLLSVEEEQPLKLADWLIYNTRPDTITRRKADGSLWYGPEDKTTGYVDSLLAYAANVQLHATALAIEHHKGERVAGALVQGLYKGFEKDKQLYHPLVYGYCKEGRAGIVPDQWASKWVRGWERSPILHYPGGVVAWLTKLTEDDLAGIFPNSEPVTIKRPFVESYFDQVILREQQIREWQAREDRDSPAQLNATFPQSFSQCDNFGGFRRACIYKEACFTPTAQRFPLTFYKPRVPHHQNEQEQQNHDHQA